MLIVSAGGPGKAIGAVISANALGVIGLLVGRLVVTKFNTVSGLNQPTPQTFSFHFFALAKLGPWPVAQAFYFFFVVYSMAYLKAQGLKWFGFTLFAILSKLHVSSL